VGCCEEAARAYRALQKFPAVDLDLVILEETALASSSSASSCICLFRLVPTTEVMTGARCLDRRPDNFRTKGALYPDAWVKIVGDLNMNNYRR